MTILQDERQGNIADSEHGSPETGNVARTQATIWHTMTETDAVSKLQVNPAEGLSDTTVQERLSKFGPNELIERKLKSPLAILWEQLTDPLILLLLGAAALSAALGKGLELIAILAIVALNAALGVFQEYRAEKAMAALKKMAAPPVRTRRNGRVQEVPSADLVPGDVVLLEAGSIIPADARVLEAANLRVQEASLTGESEPVTKAVMTLENADTPPGDRRNMLFMGTSVTYGRGTALIVETGMTTELGRIADMIQSVETGKTPLQKRMGELSQVLIRAAVVIMILSFLIGVLNEVAIQEVLLNAVAIAVAVVPEGLPAVVTVALALGAQRMLSRHALIRKLPAVETLGSVTTICSDKTGTLTENRMTVTVMDVADDTSDIDDVIAHRDDLVSMNGTAYQSTTGAQAIVLAGSTLCADAILNNYQNEDYQITGDPTEAALVVAGARFGLLKPDLETALPRVAEVPFDSARKRMTTVHRIDDTEQTGDAQANAIMKLMRATDETADYVAFTKGAVDALLPVSTHAREQGTIVPMTPDLRQRIETRNNQLAEQGLRVLGLGYRHLESVPDDPDADDLEHSLIFVGMTGMIDPPRQEVKDAVQVCKTAGIRPVMITGDHPMTAFAIAREIGIADENSRVLTGYDLSRMSEQELSDSVEDVSVYARVSPEHKLNIVKALQEKGHIAAMTGDGVNDAPALKRSDIGVAMGITGTAVSREASGMVLLDDNFATIVSAVEEGRTIYDNVRRFVKYLLASNTGELFVLLATQLIAGMTLPLTTLQILWMNLITDGVPALALGIEQSEKGVMTRQPYDPNESLFGRGLGRHIVLIGLILGITGTALGYIAWSNNWLAANGAPAWNTMVFLFLTIAQMGHALGLRSHRETLFSLNFFSNKALLGAVTFTFVVQMIAIYTPFFNDLFNTNPLTLEQLLLCFGLSTVVFWGVELEKLFIRRGILR